jgi:hypothetical protein
MRIVPGSVGLLPLAESECAFVKARPEGRSYGDYFNLKG